MDPLELALVVVKFLALTAAESVTDHIYEALFNKFKSIVQQLRHPPEKDIVYAFKQLEEKPNDKQRQERLITLLSEKIRKDKSFARLMETLGKEISENDLIFKNIPPGYQTLDKLLIKPYLFESPNYLSTFCERPWLENVVLDFINENERGCLVLEGKAGVGKSMFLAWMVSKYKFLSHFFTPIDQGQEKVDDCLANLASQLIERFGLHSELIASRYLLTPVKEKIFRFLLTKAIEKVGPSEKVVLVIDAADQVGNYLLNSLSSLLNSLPYHVFIIISQREGSLDWSDVSQDQNKLYVLRQEEHQEDIRAFLKRVAYTRELVTAREKVGWTVEMFVEKVALKAQGVWIYTKYIIEELQTGSRSLLELDTLPNGLFIYYMNYWWNFRKSVGEDHWFSSYQPVLSTLAVAQDSLTANRLRLWSGTDLTDSEIEKLIEETWRPFILVTKKNVYGNKRLEENRYQLFHSTLYDFLRQPIISNPISIQKKRFSKEIALAAQAAHQRIADFFFSKWGGLSQGLPLLQDPEQRGLEEGYGLHYLIIHLIGAQRLNDLQILLSLKREVKSSQIFLQSKIRYFHDLRQLVPLKNHVIREPFFICQPKTNHHLKEVYNSSGHYENVWYHAKGGPQGVQSYLNDIENTWHAADKNRNLLLQVLCALCWSSVRSLIDIVPPELIKASLEYGSEQNGTKISPQVALEMSLSKTTQYRQAEAIGLLGPLLKRELRQDIISLVPKIMEYREGYAFLEAAPALAAVLGKEERAKVIDRILREVNTATSTQSRIRNLVNVIQSFPLPNLEDNQDRIMLTLQALCIACDVMDCAIINFPHDNEELPVLNELTRKIKIGSDIHPNAEGIQLLTPFLNQDQAQVAYEAAKVIYDEVKRGITISCLIPKLNVTDCEEAINFVLATVEEINKRMSNSQAAPYQGALVLMHLLPFLDGNTKEKVYPRIMNVLKRGLREKFTQFSLEVLLYLQLISKVFPYLDKKEKYIYGNKMCKLLENQPDSTQEEGITSLIPHLPKSLRNVAFQMSLKLVGWYRVRTLLKFLQLPDLSPSQKKLILEEAWRININDREQGKVLFIDLAPYYPISERHEALENALDLCQTLPDYLSGPCLARLARETKTEVQNRAIEMSFYPANYANAKYTRMITITGIAPVVTRNIDWENQISNFLTLYWLDERRECAAEIFYTYYRYLPDDYPELSKSMILEKALEIIKLEGKLCLKMLWISRLAEYSMEEDRYRLWNEAQQIYNEVQDEDQRAVLRSFLLPIIPQKGAHKPIIRRAMRILMHAVPNIPDRFAILNWLIDHSNNLECFTDALDSVVRIFPDPEDQLILIFNDWIQLRAIALRELFNRVIQEDANFVEELWNAPCSVRHEPLLRTLARGSREWLIADLGGMAPALYVLGGEDAVREINNLVQEVQTWWR